MKVRCEQAGGEHRLVNWKTISRPHRLGGLGIVDLLKLSSALRLHWLWYDRTSTPHPWIGTAPPCDKRGHDAWLNGSATKFINCRKHFLHHQKKAMIRPLRTTISQQLSSKA